MRPSDLAPASRPLGSLRVLTWNIWMMPTWTGESPENEARAGAIAQELARGDFDVVCLEKAFDGRARDVIADATSARYPHRFGPVNATSGAAFTINGGVWVLSRRPMTVYREIRFDACAGVECFSRKGAILLSGDVDGRAFQLIATHLQGDDTPGFNAEHQLVRNAQLRQIREELLPRARPDVPLFVCGDLSTPRDTKDYRELLATFGIENGPEPRVTLEDSCAKNDLASDDTGREAELDYVLVRSPSNGPRVTGVWQRHVIERPGWDAEGHKNLSYRHAVSATFVW